MPDFVNIVKPDTIMRWYRRLVSQKHKNLNGAKTGRPRISKVVELFVLKMAAENPTWGYDRIAGQLQELGYDICDQTVGNVLKRHHISPTSERRRRTTWKEFIQHQKSVIWATDFFTVEAFSGLKPVSYYVLFFIHLQTRRVVLGGVTLHPNEQWMLATAHNLIESDDYFCNDDFLIMDRDTKYSLSFREMMADAGIKPIRIPPRSPNLNAYAERFVKSIKEECTKRLMFFSRRQVEFAVREYVNHYHAERCHQGIENVIPFPNGKVAARSSRLGGLLNFYGRKAS